jgi:hypothetical protein
MAAMGAPKSSRPLKPAEMIFACSCAVALLMLLAFPLRKVHRFAEHYRTAEACRMIKRHTFIAQSDSGQTRRAAVPQVEPVFFIPPRLADPVKPLATYDVFAPAPMLHLLMRMKRGTPRSQTDPLL